MSQKNKHAVALGRLGGLQRAKSLNPAARKESARHAAITRHMRSGKQKQCQAVESTENKV